LATERLVDRPIIPPNDSQGTRQRLLDAAAALFASKGYAGTTTRELAAVVGIQNASMYHHVRGKDELLLDLCIDSLTRITESGRAAIAATTDPIDRLRAAIIAHVATTLADREKHATMLSELRSLRPGARAAVIELRDAYEDLLVGVIADAQAAGSVRGDIAPRHLTLALLNLLNWTIFWWRDDGELTSDALAEMLATLFLDGALVPANPVDPRA
jgi:AcrR family transcriptional regulator